MVEKKELSLRKQSNDWSPVKTIECKYCSNKRRKDGKFVAHDIIPHLCHIEMTYACNQKCIFCYNPDRAQIGDLATIDLIVNSVAKSQIPHVYLIGGEPSLISVEKLNEYIEILSAHSSVTIVTNGLKCLKGISKKLACFGVPIHGANADIHEFLNQSKGSFAKTLETIKYYVNEGYDVRCIPVLTGYNYNQIYKIIEIAADLGMESIYVDRYEDGGVGACNSPYSFLKPTLEQFKIALGQMIQAKKDFKNFGGRIGFGTAIPYCLDERMVFENMTSNCGVGSSFCAINPKGEFRMCNQSQLVFGNLLNEPIEIIWNKPDLDIFRDLSWVEEPCNSCELLLDCTGGCKVDANCSNKFCVDYSVRGLSKSIFIKPTVIAHTFDKLKDEHSLPFRIFKPNCYAKLILRYDDKFLVTRYQTVKLDKIATEMARMVFERNISNEVELIKLFIDRVEESEIRLFISKMIKVSALELVEGGII